MWVLLLLPLILAAPLEKNIKVGELFSLNLSPKSKVTTPLPDWLLITNETLKGIPSLANVGSHQFTIQTGPSSRVLNIEVSEDFVNPCGERDTYWLEAIFNTQPKLKDQIVAAERIAEMIEVPVSKLKILDFDYSRKYREVRNMGGEEEEEPTFTIIKAACGADSDEGLDIATEDLDKVLDYDESTDFTYVATITSGRVLPKPVEKSAPKDKKISTTTVRSTTSQRTTRQVYDNSPVRLNSIAAFTCTRGIYCESIVPEATFKDAEDGNTYNLDLSITLLKGENNWLYYEDKKLRGVPLKEGQYEFRLDARDKKNQMTSAAFSVTVKDSLPSNHLVSFFLDLKPSQKIAENPELLAAFVEQLALVTAGKKEDVCVRDIFKKDDRTVVTWSNNTLPHKKCSDDGIQSMRRLMMTRNRNVMNRKFERSMTNRFNLRGINIDLSGSCAEDGAEVVTTVPSMESTAEGSFPWLILLAVLAVFFIIATLLVLLCTKKKSKKEKPSEFTGKGLPVVFPEEVGEETELAQAHTPMLTKEERPPLKVSQHENPLYKPPPPLSSASPRIGSVVSNNPNQRMPPPYVPP